jgi:hypothetical protein
MDERQLLRIISAGRVAVGTAAVLLPRRVGRSWVGADADATGTRLFARAFGVRDLALGVATMQALDAGRPVRDLVRLGAACDAVDAAATVLALRQIGLRRALPVLAVAVGATAVGLTAADGIDD